MSSKAITEKPEPEARPGQRDVAREWAPSVMSSEEPTVARWIGGFGLTFFLVGAVSLGIQIAGWTTRIGTTWGVLLLIAGVVGMLYHAARDGDLQIRRAYAVLGLLWLAGAAFALFYPEPNIGAQFMRWGYVQCVFALFFLLAFVRHETEANWRTITLVLFGAIGAAAGLTGLIGGTISGDFLLSYGLPLCLLGLGYLWAFIATLGTGEELAFRVGVATGAAGLIVFAVALVRWLLPTIFPGIVTSWNWTAPGPFLSSVGLIQMVVGLAYFTLAVGLSSETRLVVMTRRELSAFFYSPLAYFIVLGFALMAALQFGIFVDGLTRAGGQPEPIIEGMVFSLIPVFWMVLAVPLLTMRLFSEEDRTGTMEVLLTAPVKDLPIVLSKFMAVLIVFLIGWATFGLFLIALRIEGRQPFDYRPILSFGLALVCSGASFMAMGLFFSSLTRNQIVAGIVTAALMLAMVMIGLLPSWTRGSSLWLTFADYVSFLQLWRTALLGKLALKDVAFHASAAIVWLFLTLKVLESRRWR